jgi:DNA-binding transcriptional MerR regulator
MQDSTLSPRGFSIKEVSERIGVSTQTLRNWEVFFDIDIERNEYGQRIYSETSLKHFKEINHYVKTGLKLKDIKSRFNDDCRVIVEPPEKNQNFELAIINKYETRIIELTEKQDTLNRQLGRLEGELSKYNEILKLKDSQLNDKESIIADLKDRLQKQESKKWWKIWKIIKAK